MADELPTYTELEARSEKTWLTWGPNSGGAEGLMLADDHIWWFSALDWVPRVDRLPMNVHEFILKYGESTERGYADAVAYIRASKSEEGE